MKFALQSEKHPVLYQYFTTLIYGNYKMKILHN